MPKLSLNQGYVIILASVVLGVVLLIPNVTDELTSYFGIMTVFGKITAIIGVILYATSFVLTTRLKLLEKWFGGLNKVYIAHHLIAGIAFICLLLHPTFLVLRYLPQDINAAASQILPAFAPYNFALNAGIFGLWTLILLMILTFYVKLPYHIWHFTHKFLGLAFLLAVLHVYFIPSDVSDDILLRIYILAWCLIGLVAFTYYTLLGKFTISRISATVTKVIQHSPSITIISLKSDSADKLDFKPGQFVFVRFYQEGISKEEHPFSIASFIEPDTLQLSIKSNGDYTNKMPEITKGTQVEIEGAYGAFDFTKASKKQQLWIAGGIGITPFLAMAQTLQKHSDYDIALIYAVNNRPDLIGIQLIDYMQNHANFRVINHIGSEQSGFIDSSFITASVPDFTNREIFMCGPIPMMQAVSQQLQQSGIEKKYIHTEEFTLQ